MKSNGHWKKLVLLVNLFFLLVPVVKAQYQLETYSMGTYWIIRADFQNQSFHKSSLDKKVISVLQQYDSTFSDWRDNSELGKLLPHMTKWQKSSSLFQQGLLFSKYFYKMSDQYFDITVGAVLKNLRKEPIGLNHLKIKNNMFRFTKHPAHLTFNGFVKGMAIGQIVKEFEKLNIKNYFIDGGGGNIALKGERWGVFHSYNLKKSDSTYFISKSALFQGKRKHIIGDNESTQIVSTTICELKKDPVFTGALSDALSTLRILTKNIADDLSKECIVI
ncbi:MAG: FAD:protein FMN transferase [Bacteriovoracaceae bacterium]